MHIAAMHNNKEDHNKTAMIKTTTKIHIITLTTIITLHSEKILILECTKLQGQPFE